MCSACAADNFKSFYQNRTLISAPVCQNVLSTCGSHFADVFDLVKLVGPYGTLLKVLEEEETKSRIDQEEKKFNAKKEDQFMDLYDTLLKAQSSKKAADITSASYNLCNAAITLRQVPLLKAVVAYIITVTDIYSSGLLNNRVLFGLSNWGVPPSPTSQAS